MTRRWHAGWTAAAVLVVSMAATTSVHAAGDDPRAPEQWGLQTIGAPAAWARATGAGRTIAVVDTGIDLAHEDLSDRVVAHVSCIGADDDPSQCGGSGQDDHGHGSHVAGIAAAATGNGVGVAGTAPGAALMAVKVLQPDATGGATGDLGDVRAGIRWAVGHGADVINLSLGENVAFRNLLGSGLEGVVAEAWAQGVIVVIAAGNLPLLFPAGYGGLDALVVTATTRQDTQAGYATDVGEAKWGMAAPGGDGADPDTILSTYWRPNSTNAYAFEAGTSMAAPHVSGAAALLLSAGWGPQGAIDRILATTVDLGAPGRDAAFGYGRLDLRAAAAGSGNAPAPATPPPAARSETPPSGTSTPIPVPPSVRGAQASAMASSSAPQAPASIPAGDPAPPAPEPVATAAPIPGRDDAGPAGGLRVAAFLALTLGVTGAWWVRRRGRVGGGVEYADAGPRR